MFEQSTSFFEGFMSKQVHFFIFPKNYFQSSLSTYNSTNFFLQQHRNFSLFSK